MALSFRTQVSRIGCRDNALANGGRKAVLAPWLATTCLELIYQFSMNLYRSGWVGAFLAFNVIGAEVTPQQCARGDSACYTKQHASACATRSQSTPQSCLDWVVSLEERATSGDRAALRAQADAYGFLATLLKKGDIEQESARQSALKKYRELMVSDPEDSGAMLGIATFTESATERVQLLREVVWLKPHQISVDIFLEELRKVGTREALLEAGKVADDYQRNSRRPDWRFAAQAIELYRKAGDSERAADVRRRAQQQIGVPAVQQELSDIRASNPDRTVQLLDSICETQILATIGAQPCLDALESTVSSLGGISDPQGAQRLADRAAAIVGNLHRASSSALAEADPGWHPRLLGLLERVPAQGFESATTWYVISKVDRTPTGRNRALERAASLGPDNASFLSELGSSYLELGRWDEAIAAYRRAKAATPPDRVDRQRELDRYIQAAEDRRAMSPAPSLR